VFHGDDHTPRARHQIHRAAHALDHLAGDHPVGQRAFLIHFHRAQDAQVDVAATDHGERVGGGEERRARQSGDRLLAGVDEVGVHLGIPWPGAYAEHPILRLQNHLDAGRNVVGYQRRQSNPQIDVIAVAQLAGHAAHDTLAFGQCG
jgi:hypothetical protein